MDNINLEQYVVTKDGIKKDNHCCEKCNSKYYYGLTNIEMKEADSDRRITVEIAVRYCDTCKKTYRVDTYDENHELTGVSELS